MESWKQAFEATRLNYLMGLTFPRWRQVRRENGVDSAYRRRAALLTMASLRNSMLERREERQFGARLRQVTEVRPPLFILGHWRSGTTHLHNLLSQDPGLAFPTSFQVIFPYAFLTCEDEFRRKFAAWEPKTRPMDNVLLGYHTPQEEEHALAILCQRSPYLGMLSFPRRADHYLRYLDFEGASPAEVEEWKATLLAYVRKLTFKYGLPLVLKSPTHTARIRPLLELFPDARFVHIHRDPYAVFQSMRHLMETLPRFDYLQHGDPANLDARILHWYTRMYDAFFAQRQFIPDARYYEIGYEALERDPMGEMRKLYEALNLPCYEALRPELEAYMQSIAGYQKNRHVELPPETRRRVAREWARSFDEWSYPT